MEKGSRKLNITDATVLMIPLTFLDYLYLNTL